MRSPSPETLMSGRFHAAGETGALEAIRIIDRTKQIVVCGTGLLLWYDCVRTTKPRNRINTTFLFGTSLFRLRWRKNNH